MGTPGTLIAVIGGVLALAACGSQRADEAGDDPAVDPPADVMPDDYQGRFRGTSITVLSSPEHGPQLCAAVAESHPPQCGGPDIVGWDWSVVEHETASGTRWGTYDVVGTFADGAFTLTERPGPPSPPPAREPDPGSACPEPPEGWDIPDRSKATPEDQGRAISTAHGIEGFADGWIGWLIPDDQLTERTAADPDNYILNVRTTGDVATMEAAVRAVWGGKLCVVASTNPTARELNRIAHQIGSTPGLVSVGADTMEGNVDVGVWVAYEGLWEQFTEEHGADVIDLSGVLQPIDDHK